ncbi:hypothetical protein N7532_007551 [Penicillium argentinense]|uniref:Uncharacterized protein n=1 Tax=Penicillium argentinense TaxID=1131581 RepID=A0A9W9F843_9EURO|nr:uncharacterized protein N7532_007551 [Penicillium argentinense]KAJ5095260.1 hypothetical protein N7532_007551 [Penicillium argentinense]
MFALSINDQARFETTKRLLGQLVNERLVSATSVTEPSTGTRYLCICNPKTSDGSACQRRVKVEIHAEARVKSKDGFVVSWIRPQILEPRVLLCDKDEEISELDPKRVFRFISPWLADDSNGEATQRVEAELELAAAFQVKWLERNMSSRPPSIGSRTIDWEQAVTFGHPNHPVRPLQDWEARKLTSPISKMHRCCRSLPSIPSVSPNDLSTLLSPNIAFVSVPQDDILVKGPFEQSLRPLLERLQVPPPAEDDRLVIPCFERQLPLIYKSFPRVTLLKVFTGCADAEASIRSVRLKPHIASPYLFKMSLACQITAALRIITPWDVFQTAQTTKILDKIRPSFWVFREIAAVCGSQNNYREASDMACILREDLELRARDNDETMIIVGSLVEPIPGSSQTRLERLFGLDTIDQKRKWMRNYTRTLFEAVFPILSEYGISLEGHLQNFVVRVCNKTKDIKGLAYRDFGGVLMHKSTLREKGFNVDWMHPNGRILTDDREFIWQQTHHTVIQSHVGNVLHALRLETNGGWAIVREELTHILIERDRSETKKKVYEYMTREFMDVKCYFDMRIKDTRLVSNLASFLSREILIEPVFKEIMKQIPNILLS